jgi:hypothetical protein
MKTILGLFDSEEKRSLKKFLYEANSQNFILYFDQISTGAQESLLSDRDLFNEIINGVIKRFSEWDSKKGSFVVRSYQNFNFVNVFNILNFWLEKIHFEVIERSEFFQKMQPIFFRLLEKGEVAIIEHLLIFAKKFDSTYKRAYIDYYINAYHKYDGQEIKALMLSIKLNNVDLVQLLLENGAIKSTYNLTDEYAEQPDFQLPGLIAMLKEIPRAKLDKMKLLLGCAGIIYNFQQTAKEMEISMAVTQATLKGDIKELKSLLAAKTPKDIHQITPLPVHPSKNGEIPPIKELLDLYLAAKLSKEKVSKDEFEQKGLGECLELLVQAGSDVEIPLKAPDIRYARQVILDHKLISGATVHTGTFNLQPDFEIPPIATRDLLLYPQLISQVRAMPYQAFVYFSFLFQCYSKKPESHEIFSINQGAFSKLIGAYCTIFPDAKASNLRRGADFESTEEENSYSFITGMDFSFD